MNLLDLSDCELELILEYLSYDEISKKRMVCSRFDSVCQRLLNRGFNKVVVRHADDLKRFKALLPRRESERRNHLLSRHADILTCVETRISMLSMTYNKHIEAKLCCFIPGKVLDELNNVLNLVNNTKTSLRPHEVLQELRDISSMAIEHFDEKIVKMLRRPSHEYSGLSSFIGSTSCCSTPKDGLSPMSFDLISQFRLPSRRPAQCRAAELNRLNIERMEKSYQELSKKFSAVINIQKKQSLRLRNYALLTAKLNSQVLELTRRLDEAHSKSPEVLMQSSTPPLLKNPESIVKVNSISNIKPRAATIILKRRIDESRHTTSDDESSASGSDAKKVKT